LRALSSLPPATWQANDLSDASAAAPTDLTARLLHRQPESAAQVLTDIARGARPSQASGAAGTALLVHAFGRGVPLQHSGGGGKDAPAAHRRLLRGAPASPLLPPRSR